MWPIQVHPGEPRFSTLSLNTNVRPLRALKSPWHKGVSLNIDCFLYTHQSVSAVFKVCFKLSNGKIGTTWEFVRNTNSQAPPRPTSSETKPAIHDLISLPDDFYTHGILRAAVPCEIFKTLTCVRTFPPPPQCLSWAWHKKAFIFTETYYGMDWCLSNINMNNN